METTVSARRLILRSFQSPGDLVMLTAAMRDLHVAAPGRFLTDVRTSADALFENNPHITRLNEADSGVESVDMHYPLVHQSNQRPYHFIHGYAQFLEERLGLRIPVTRFAGDVYLSDAEKRLPPPGNELGVPEHFWIIVAGGKHDFTAKWWNPASYQKVVDHFRGKVQFVQCGEAGHWHPPLDGVINLVGKTSTREFLRLMYHADGVVCPVTLAMHLAAAVETKPGRPKYRPCVVIAGGREPKHWEAYPHHQFLDTLGMLPCCADGGCWKSRCQTVGDGDPKDHQDLCVSPVEVRPDLSIPRCMEMITPVDVIRRIEMYYEGGALKFTNGRATVAPTIHAPTAPTPPVVQRSTNVLIKFNHGLGDAVQLTCVLKHLAKYRPDWNVDVASLVGKHSAHTGICRRVLIQDRDRIDESQYQQVFDLGWHENYSVTDDSPCTKVCNCLREVFGIKPDPDLLRYDIHVSPDSMRIAGEYLHRICNGRKIGERYPAVVIHYQGNTSAGKKNLAHEDVKLLCQELIRAGYMPVILDWDHRSPLPDQQTIFCPDADTRDLWHNTGTGDAERLAALISQCALMVGVDSGPLHVAGATDTPTLACWIGHMPVQFFDLCPNVLHLVPENWRAIPPCHNPKAVRFFEKNYRFETFNGFRQALVHHALRMLGPLQERPDEGLEFCSGFWIRKNNFEQDLVIVQDVYSGDAYRTHLLSSNAGPQVIVDIGAHIGCFAKRWHEKNPEARIICVEACPENLPALRANVGDFAEIVPAACTYETEPMALLNAVRPDCESTGGSVVVPRSELETSNLRQEGYKYWNDLRELPTVTLEQLRQRFGFDHIDVLKLDCEGSEYSILGHTPSLDRIRMIVGEYHGHSRWDSFRQERMQGWDYGHMLDGGESGGLFHYANPVWPPQPLPSNEVALATPPTIPETTVVCSADKSARRPLIRPPLLRVAVPAGIGDSVWGLLKIPSMLRAYGATKAHIALCGGPPYRSLPFIERFDFVESAENSRWECIESDRYTPEGVYNWAPSGIGWHNEFDWMLQANRHLESGQRLETWLPEFETDFDIADRFLFTGGELRQARALEQRLGPYCVFYLGPEAGNTTFGHNRGPLWKPEEWGQLATLCRELGLQIVVVGADYDRSYFERHVAPHLGACYDAVGKWPIGQTFAVIQRSRFVVAYQSGIGIFSVYLGIPAACFWRPQGDSIDPSSYVSFSEQMASAWAPPESLETGRYLPLIYTRCSPQRIADHAVKHGWHKP